MKTAKWNYEALADAADAVVLQSWKFQGELCALCNQDSYLDRKSCAELLNETVLAQRFVMAVLFWVAGWTEDEFDRALAAAVEKG